MRPMPVVSMSIGPFTQRALDEAFGLAIGAWGVGFGEAMTDTQLTTGLGEVAAAIARTVVGEDLAHRDSQPGVVGDRRTQKGRRTERLFIRQDLAVGHTRSVVDGDMYGRPHHLSEESARRQLERERTPLMKSPEKIALVTGAGTGIGRAVSIALAEDGYTVIVAGRRIQPLTEVAEEITRLGGRALAIVADVSKEDSTTELFAAVKSNFGRLDLLFNNAGTNAPAAPLEELTLAQWQSVIDVNLTGAFLCTQAAFRLMKNQTPRGGRIINNGSISAHTPRPNSAPYTASKHAISGLTKCTALDGRAFDIACGQIDIGNAMTAIGSHVTRGALQPNGSTMVEPMLELAHVAQAVKYMASLPLTANVLTLTVMATGMPFVGRG
jgi:NAD(P)-dependent dehydrogenase (short-subunit alcohol dehydrogenase family)